MSFLDAIFPAAFVCWSAHSVLPWSLPHFDFVKNRPALLLLAALVIAWGTPGYAVADALVTFEAESGSLGSDWVVSNSSSPAYITITSNSTGNNPGSAQRVATYTVTFPSAGTYQVYARVRVGPDTFNDDSMFYAASFGTKSPTNNSDWVFVNGLGAAGFSDSTDVVTGGGSLGSGMWKWINLSQFAGNTSFTVGSGRLMQTFQISAREDGLSMDKFAFGTLGTSFIVSNLDTGTLPPALILTNTFSGPDGNALHRFNPLDNGLNLDGANPMAGLALSGGALVGTTLTGGTQGAGTAFWLSPDGMNFSTFRTFTNAPDAGDPQAELSFSGTTFFSTTFSGGANGVGAVIVGQTNGSISLLKSFAAANADNATNSGGASPNAALANSGTGLFGTTPAGGAAGNGTIFSLTTNGATFTVLRNFSALDLQAGTNTDGAFPQGGLILSGGTLYGTASAGGAGGNGVIFSIGTNGANFTTLHDFTPMDTFTGTNADGAVPLGGLVLSNTTLYGITSAGGAGACGTVFSIQTNGSGFTVLHQFTAIDPVARTNAAGASPCAALLLSGNRLSGTASAGGAGAAGVVFALNSNGAQFNVLHSFTPVAASGTNADGAFPVAPLLHWGNSLYGTTSAGGPGAVGTVFTVAVPPPPAVITNIVKNVDGTATLYFLGGPNSTNVVQSAASLVPPVVWRNVSTNVADATGVWQFTDGINDATRLYRSYAR